MSASASGRLEALLARWVGFCTRRAGWVTAASLLAAALAGAWAVAHFRVDTDRNAMLSSRLAFKREEERVARLFPQFADDLVIVVDGRTPESARDTALALARELRGRSELFHGAYVPRADPFLERHGLLFRSTDELRALGRRLAQVQPLLGRLSRDPSLRGLFDLLRQAVDASAQGDSPDLGGLERELAASLSAALSGETRELSWQELMAGGGEASLDARRQYVLAQPVLDYGRVFAGAPAIEAVRAIVARDRLDGTRGVRVRITGGLALSHEELSSVLAGAEVIAALVLVLVGAMLYAALRSWRLVASVLVVLVAGLALTTALALATVGHFNLLSIAFAALYLGLGVDYAIHSCLRWRELVAAGEPNTRALVGAARDLGGPLALCALTTACGFFSFVPTDYAGVAELGLISGLGMFVSLAATLTLLPALLALRAPRRELPRPASSRPSVQRWLELPVRRSGAVLALAGLLGAAALVLAPRLRFDPNPLALRDPRSESVSTFRELLETSATPPWSATVLAEDSGAARDLAARLGALDEVDEVVWLESFVPDEQDAKLLLLEELALMLGPELELATDAARPTLDEQRAAASALAAALDRQGASDPGGADPAAVELRRSLGELASALDGPGADELAARAESSVLATLPQSLQLLRAALEAGPVTSASLPGELRARWQSSAGTLRIEAFPRAGIDLEDAPELERFVRAVQSVAPAAVGAPVVMLESGRAVVGAFRLALLLALAAIGSLVFAVLRRPLDVALALAPLALASLLTAATMVACGMAFNFANVVALPLMLGIGVDSGIHMVERERRGRSRRELLLASSTARGVFYSALTTIASFANLALSSHPGTASLGATLTIAILWTLACSLIVLPALLARLR